MLKGMKRTLLAALAVVLLTTGCWNRRELNELAIVVGLAIDRGSGEGVRVSAQVVEPTQVATGRSAAGGGSRSPVTTYSVEGTTVFEAIRKLTTMSPRILYLSHLRIVVFGEELAKEGIAEELEFLSRDHQVRSDFFIIVAKGEDGREVLNQLTPLVKNPSQNLFSSLETSERAWAPTHGALLDELIDTLVSKGRQPVLTGIRIVGDKAQGETQKNVETIESPARLRYDSLAVFRGDKLAGWLTSKESKGWNYITDQVQSTVGPVPCPDGGEISIEIIRSHARIKADVRGGRPALKVSVSAEGNIGEVRCGLDINNPDNIPKVEKAAERKIIEAMDASVKRAQEFKADIFGFGDALHRAAPDFWKKESKHWGERFATLPVDVHAHVTIRRTGTTNKSYLQDLED